MKLKTLLLCTTLFSAFSANAQAAPKIPEKNTNPDSVRACNAYGPGYFYVPGTSTCIKLSGYVRMILRGGSGNIEATSKADIDKKTEGLDWKTRGSFTIQSATDTSLGTLRSYMQFREDWQMGGTYENAPKYADNAELHFAYVELGGLRFGLDESIFSHWTGYFGSVLSDDLLNPMTTKRTNVVSYVFNAQNGFSGILGFEQGTANKLGITGYTYSIKDNKIEGISHNMNYHVNDYLPNVVAGLKYMQGWGGLSAVAAYDAYYKKFSGKLRLDGNFGNLNLWAMGAYKNQDDYFTAIPENQDGVTETGKTIHIVRAPTSIYGDWYGEWEAWLGGSYRFNDQIRANAQISYDAGEDLAAALSFDYKVTPNFVITPEIAFLKNGKGLNLSVPTVTNITDTQNIIYDASNHKGVRVSLQLTRSF